MALVRPMVRSAAVLILVTAIVSAGAWPSLTHDPTIRSEVLSGQKAVAFLDAQEGRYTDSYERTLHRREAELTKKGWLPAGEEHVYVRRSYRDVTLTRRLAEMVAPVLYADTYWHNDGYIDAASWDDGNPDTWEGYVEVCSYSYGCDGGVAQIHTGSGDVIYASGSQGWRRAVDSWAVCSYAWCVASTWACLGAGPGYFGCAGWGCVGAAVGCGLHEWMMFHQTP